MCNYPNNIKSTNRISGTILTAFHVLTNLISTRMKEVGTTIISILHTWVLRHKDVRKLAQGHTGQEVEQGLEPRPIDDALSYLVTMLYCQQHYSWQHTKSFNFYNVLEQAIKT